MSNLLPHIIPSIVLGYLLQSFLHESGHLVGGILTGWRFLYIQFFYIVLQRNGKRLKLKFVPCLSCQCIMYPKRINQGALLYTMGGCIMNLISALVGLFIMLVSYTNPVIWLYAWSFFVFGIVLFLLNGIANTKRVCNDKACYNLLKAENQTRLCHNIQLMIAKYLNEGMTYGQISEECICLCPEKAVNDIQAYQAVLEYYYYLDQGNYERMKHSLNKVNDKTNISGGVWDVICLERTYIDFLIIIFNLNNPNVDQKYTDIDECIKRHGKKGDIHSIRVETVFKAYKYLSKGNREDAVLTIEDSIIRIERKDFIYEGEKVFCIRQLKQVLKSLT